MNFRYGQWVTFRPGDPIPGAHVTEAGLVVGIYQRARVLPTGNSEDPPVLVPEHVAVCRPDGTNLMRLADDGQSLVKVAPSPADCPGLRAAAVPDDLPRCDRNAHLFDPGPDGGRA